MAEKINVSIVLIARNNSSSVDRCMQSLLKQPGLETEIIIINDGSEDDTLDKLKVYADKYKSVHLFDQRYKGPANSLNKSLRQLKGTYTLFLFAGNELMPFSLQLVYREACKANADVMMMPVVYGSSRKTGSLPHVTQPLSGRDMIRRYGGRYNLFLDSRSFLVRTDFIEDESLKFDHRMFYLYEFDFFSRMVMSSVDMVVSTTPCVISEEKRMVPAFSEEDELKQVQQEIEYLKRNMNEFVEARHFSAFEREVLDYMYAMFMCDLYDCGRLSAMPAAVQVEAMKCITANILKYGGRFRLRRLYKYRKVKRETGNISRR